MEVTVMSMFVVESSGESWLMFGRMSGGGGRKNGGGIEGRLSYCNYSWGRTKLELGD